MITGLLSDVHGRIDALEIAYNEASVRCDQIVCLGDIVNGGGDADACMDFVRQNQIPTVRGNHDDAWLAMCTFSDFGTPNHKFMRALPTWLAHEGLVLVHEDPALATDSSDDFLGSQGYINSQEQADRAFEAASVFADGPRVVAIGHTHIPSVFTNKGQLELQPRSPVLLPPDASCIINPGAVGGRPRSRWGNTYATYDTVKRELTIYKLNLPELDDPWEGFFRRIVS